MAAETGQSSPQTGKKKAGKKKNTTMSLQSFLSGGPGSEQVPGSSSWADEPAEAEQEDYRGSSDRYEDRGGYSRNYEDKQGYGDRGGYGRENRPREGNYNRGGDRGENRGYGDRGENRGYGDRGENRGYGDRGENRGYGDRGENRGYGDRSENRGYGDRRDNRENRGYGDRRDNRENRDRPEYGDRNREGNYGRYGGDRDRSERGDRGDGDRQDYGDRGNREYRDGDRNERREPIKREPKDLPTQPPFSAFVGNLPFTVQEEELTNYFLDHGCRVLKTRLPIRDNRPKGYGYVNFEDLESLKNALSLNGLSWKGREIRIDIAEKEKSPMSNSMPPSRSDTAPWRRNDEDRPSLPKVERPAGRGGRVPTRDRSPLEDSPKERPKVVVHPRSNPEPIAAPARTSGKVNPFGDAKPRDEQEILRKKEEERKKRDDEDQDKDSREENEKPPSWRQREEKLNSGSGWGRDRGGNDRNDRNDRNEGNEGDRGGRGNQSRNERPSRGGAGRGFGEGRGRGTSQQERKADPPRKEERREPPKKDDKQKKPIAQPFNAKNDNPFSALSDDA